MEFGLGISALALGFGVLVRVLMGTGSAVEAIQRRWRALRSAENWPEL
jgi:hypothetical protein